RGGDGRRPRAHAAQGAGGARGAGGRRGPRRDRRGPGPGAPGGGAGRTGHRRRAVPRGGEPMNADYPGWLPERMLAIPSPPGGAGYKGRAGVVYEVRRPACHSSSPDEKAVETAVRFWLDVRHRCEEPVAGPRFEAPTAALTRLEGDAEHATVWIDCRVPPAFDL